jgi:hypothetical protein
VAWIVCIVGLLSLLYHIQSLADATMVTSACNLLQGKNDIKVVTLPWQPELVVYCRAETT